MAGAYVAKPYVFPPFEYPPLWNVDWPFPGPAPPGYAPNYSLVIDTNDVESINSGDNLGVSINVYDHGTFPTVEPSEPAVAVILDGATVSIRNGTEGDYSSELNDPFTSADGLWGINASLGFELEKSTTPREIEIVASCLIDGVEVTGRKSIAINVEDDTIYDTNHDGVYTVTTYYQVTRIARYNRDTGVLVFEGSGDLTFRNAIGYEVYARAKEYADANTYTIEEEYYESIYRVERSITYTAVIS